VILANYSTATRNAVESGALPEPVLPAETFSGRRSRSWSGAGTRGTCPSSRRARSAPGISTRGSRRRVSRRVPMLVEYKGQFYNPSPSRSCGCIWGFRRPCETRRRGQAARGHQSTPFRIASSPAAYTGVEWLRSRAAEDSRETELTSLAPFRGPARELPLHFVRGSLGGQGPTDKLRGRSR